MVSTRCPLKLLELRPKDRCWKRSIKRPRIIWCVPPEGWGGKVTATVALCVSHRWNRQGEKIWPIFNSFSKAGPASLLGMDMSAECLHNLHNSSHITSQGLRNGFCLLWNVFFASCHAHLEHRHEAKFEAQPGPMRPPCWRHWSRGEWQQCRN